MVLFSHRSPVGRRLSDRSFNAVVAYRTQFFANSGVGGLLTLLTVNALTIFILSGYWYECWSVVLISFVKLGTGNCSLCAGVDVLLCFIGFPSLCGSGFPRRHEFIERLGVVLIISKSSITGTSGEYCSCRVVLTIYRWRGRTVAVLRVTWDIADASMMFSRTHYVEGRSVASSLLLVWRHCSSS